MIHYFNPGHEVAVLNSSPYYTVPSNVATMRNDLASLPIWYADPIDYVLVKTLSDKQFREQLLSYFPFLPTAITKEQLPRFRSEMVELWGISPESLNYVKELNKTYHTNLQVPIWRDTYKYLNSRKCSSDCLQGLVDEIPEISSDIIPQYYTNLDQVEKAVSKSAFRLLAKAPYSSSGKGLVWLPQGELTRTERQILGGIIKKQGCVSVEKILNKKMDFAMEFCANNSKSISFLGYSLFNTNHKGAYERNLIASSDSLRRILSDSYDLCVIDKVKDYLCDMFESKFAPIYEGKYIGVDMMIYEQDGDLLVHPCVEINMRCNMGILALKFSENYLNKNSKGYLFIDFEAAKGTVYEKHLLLTEKHKPKFDRGKLRSGYLPLCPVSHDNHYWAYVLAEEVL